MKLILMILPLLLFLAVSAILQQAVNGLVAQL
jgi:hypothetical protein